MKTIFKLFPFLLLLLLICCCSSNNDNQVVIPEVIKTDYKYLALGDSYTIGQSVCGECNFPAQLKDSLKQKANIETSLKIIATTGWTTTNLKNAIINEAPLPEYDLVTLLIGVNNQYQNKPFSIYQSEFPELLDTAISLAKGNASHVIVVSIPDYAYTPYGQNFFNPTTSSQIDQYNNFARMITSQKNAVFIDVTDITRMGLQDTDLVASDGLHPSEKAYSKFVQRLLPEARKILK